MVQPSSNLRMPGCRTGARLIRFRATYSGYTEVSRDAMDPYLDAARMSWEELAAIAGASKKLYVWHFSEVAEVKPMLLLPATGSGSSNIWVTVDLNKTVATMAPRPVDVAAASQASQASPAPAAPLPLPVVNPPANPSDEASPTPLASEAAVVEMEVEQEGPTPPMTWPTPPTPTPTLPTPQFASTASASTASGSMSSSGEPDVSGMDAPSALAPPPTTATPAPPMPESVVNSLHTAFSWGDHFTRVLVQKFGIRVLTLFREAIGNATYSTSFSGIDAPGTALLMLSAAVDDFLDANGVTSASSSPTTPMPKHTSAVEKFKESAAELLVHPSRPGCLYEDVEDTRAC